jgi:hypothetical protein
MMVILQAMVPVSLILAWRRLAVPARGRRG